MPLIYNLASPIDIANIEKPVYVDTNTILDLYYPSGSLVANKNVTEKQAYHQFIRDLFSQQKKIHITAQVLMEMENKFVNKDKDKYRNSIGNKKMSLKEYRRIPEEQTRRKDQYSQVFDQIFGNDMIECTDSLVQPSQVESFVHALDIHTLDPNDFILAEICKLENAILLTDDQDFASVIIKCDVITNNQALVTAAQANGFTLAN